MYVVNERGLKEQFKERSYNCKKKLYIVIAWNTDGKLRCPLANAVVSCAFQQTEMSRVVETCYSNESLGSRQDLAKVLLEERISFEFYHGSFEGLGLSSRKDFTIQSVLDITTLHIIPCSQHNSLLIEIFENFEKNKVYDSPPIDQLNCTRLRSLLGCNPLGELNFNRLLGLFLVCHVQTNCNLIGTH